jgi:hypothetical protein
VSTEGYALLLSLSTTLGYISKLLGFQADEHPSEGVVRRNAVGKLQKLTKPPFLRNSELFDVLPTVGVADYCTDGDGEDIDEFVQLVSFDPRVFELAEVVDESRGLLFIHVSLPGFTSGRIVSQSVKKIREHRNLRAAREFTKTPPAPPLG